MVIWCADSLCDVNCCEQKMCARKRTANFRKELASHIFEGFSHPPGPILSGRVYVGENPKNAGTARRSRRKRVDVQQPIVLSIRSRNLLLDERRSETGSSLSRGVRMPRKQGFHKFARDSTVSRYRGGELARFRAGDGRTSKPIRGRVVTDVLSPPRPPARREEAMLHVMELKGQVRTVEYLTVLQDIQGLLLK